MENTNPISNHYLHWKRKRKKIILAVLFVFVILGTLIGVYINFRIKDKKFFEVQNQLHTKKSYQAYLDKYGQHGRFIKQAQDSIYVFDTMENNIFIEAHNKRDYNLYLKKHPYGRFSTEVRNIQRILDYWNSYEQRWKNYNPERDRTPSRETMRSPMKPVLGYTKDDRRLSDKDWVKKYTPYQFKDDKEIKDYMKDLEFTIETEANAATEKNLEKIYRSINEKLPYNKSVAIIQRNGEEYNQLMKYRYY